MNRARPLAAAVLLALLAASSSAHETIWIEAEHLEGVSGYCWPAGQAKPQQGITPTDFRENRRVTIRSAAPVAEAADWLFPEETLVPQPRGTGSSLEVTVPAGGVRIVELKTR